MKCYSIMPCDETISRARSNCACILTYLLIYLFINIYTRVYFRKHEYPIVIARLRKGA